MAVGPKTTGRHSRLQRSVRYESIRYHHITSMCTTRMMIIENNCCAVKLGHSVSRSFQFLSMSSMHTQLHNNYCLHLIKQDQVLESIIFFTTISYHGRILQPPPKCVFQHQYLQRHCPSTNQFRLGDAGRPSQVWLRWIANFQTTLAAEHLHYRSRVCLYHVGNRRKEMPRRY